MMHAVPKKAAAMLDGEFRSLVRSFRARAEEILLRADTMRDADARLMMREIADGYEKLARRVEQGAGVPPRG